MSIDADRPVAWVVAGPPAAGKSSVVDIMLGRMRPAPARLDKDTLFGGLVAELLQAYGRPHGEREGRWYDVHVKRHEYGGMTAAARQIRSGGCPVLLEGPFTTEVRDERRWRSWVADLGGEPVRLVWVIADRATLLARMTARGEARDVAKLEAFDAFLARVRLSEPPVVPHVTVDNSVGSSPLTEQIRALLEP